MKKIFFILILLLIPFVGVDATSIKSIDMDIYVDQSGTATVTETWDATVDQGTEGWHPYYNLGNSELSDLKVTMDGKDFKTVSSWNENSSLFDKAYKAGFYYPGSNEVDICFGISSYGSHLYVIQYKISNFVSTIEDADIIYWNLFPHDFSAEPESVTIKIYSDFRYADTLDVWGYGDYGAPCYVYDGRIEMSSNGKLSSSEYLTILVKFDKGTFQTSNVLENNFDYYYNLAEEGATNYVSGNNGIQHVGFLNKLIFIFYIFPIILIILIAFFIKRNREYSVSLGAKRKKFSKDVSVFREIPCNHDIYCAYWLANRYGLIERNEDFIGTIILKLIQNGNVKLERVNDKGNFGKNETDIIVFVKRPTDEVEFESKLYDLLYSASLNGRLGKDSFNSWCRQNYSKILGWTGDLIFFETLILLKQAKIIRNDDKKMSILNYNSYEVSSELEEEVEKLAGLRKFLEEFTLMKEKEVIEVKLWNEYLMYAQMFGIADKVSKQIEKLYPEIKGDTESMCYAYHDICFIHSIIDNGIRCANHARSVDKSSSSRRVSDYSSGGGGSSSGGGGSGSFGSGSGGGGFR